MNIMNSAEVIRDSDRWNLGILVEGRMRSRNVCFDLIDVSQGGCKIRGKLGFATEGETINLKINGVRAPLGKIVWVEDNFAGVAFEGRMHEAVLDHLQKELLARNS